MDHKIKLRSAKGQLPFVELNGAEICDSAHIVKQLAVHYGRDLDAGLSAEQKNAAHALISMVENHLVWVVVWWRAKNPALMLKGLVFRG